MRISKKFFIWAVASVIGAVGIFFALQSLRPHFFNAQHHPKTQRIQQHAEQISFATDAPTVQKKTIYLTLDADMTQNMRNEILTKKVKAHYDPELISYLESNQIPTTFFVTDMFAEVYPDVVKDIASHDYFAIENHTYDHPGFESPCFGLRTISTDVEKISEMQKTQSILSAITGKMPQYLRHPGLCHNGHDDDLAAQNNLKVSDNGVISGDPFLHDPNAIVENVLKQIKTIPKTEAGTIIIFHVGGPHTPGTTNAIKMLVPILKEKGFAFGHL